MSAPAPGQSFAIRPALGAGDLAEVRRLVLMHADLRATTPGVEYMRADALALPGPYAPPSGGLWLAVADDAGIGCVALRSLGEGMGEVKRMFVAPEWRGHGVGRALMERLVAEARARGFATLRLGTLHDMTEAQALYRSLGFRSIERYRADEMIDTRFMEMAL